MPSKKKQNNNNYETNKLPASYLKFKICVSGAAETGHCAINALDLAKELGKEIVRQGGVLVTGATSGVPYRKSSCQQI
ncbi:MAG: hypothetical protein UX48_C0022G0009 [Candidatus Azambacteria bacterium GW2011_GWB1_46_27]|uniref:Uncharacterized protein n=1 Tax=Candidatus Azambacteria bacterium GW2011_GWB1_46_27 TaxID=1618617 RepID=A0A0G1PQG8_9BACT|nr:MAG: hypothetical protein UX48_C0022G0009 [Candidatus Azambacteria bacterium GW2011_GWB1_46_27]